MNLSLNGIVLKSTEYGKNSRMLTLLTGKSGRVNVIARGCVSLKSQIHAPATLFAYSSMEIVKNTDKYYLNSAEIKELFYPLHNDIYKLSLAQYFAEVTLTVAQTDSEEEELLRLILNSLFILCKSEDYDFIKAVFEIKLAQILGYMPDIEGCATCGKVGEGYIGIDDGCLYCKACRPNVRAVFLNESALKALEHIYMSDVSKIFSFKITGESYNQLINFGEKYLIAQTDIRVKSLDFYKSLQK